MKIRYRGPQGAGTVELPDDATVQDLISKFKDELGFTDVTVKYGWPLKAISAAQNNDSLKSLGLDRENLTVAAGAQETQQQAEAEATSTPATASPPAPAAPAPALAPEALPGVQSSSQGQGSQGIKDQNISVFMPETGSSLVLRVMPDDNSCLFTAVGGALRGLRPGADENFQAPALRRLVVDHILANPEKYNAAVLEKSPETYCANMLKPDVWGGNIELSILSEVFAIEICVVDVKTGNVYNIGEGNNYEMRCVVVYSSVHYDRVAEIFVEGQEEMEFDVTRWAVDSSDHVIAHTKEMCALLKKQHYYTDTSDFVVMCNTCGWIGQGQQAVAQHSMDTRHDDLREIKDTH
ncbi:OTU-domain-containing protein [Hypoxylon sp. FL1857]|nr:OTU-domain-containing protein [Hypoxylon sp. FL1857]